MNITIVGAGNVGTQIATHCAEKGHSVTIFGSKPEKISKHLTVVNEFDEEIHSGDIKCATNDTAVAFKDAELIFVVMPAFCMQDNANKIEPFAKPGMRICIVPGTGGGECAFSGCIKKGATVFGLQRVPSVARLVEYGKRVKATGYRDTLFVAALPASEARLCAEMISGIMDMPCGVMPNYLNLTLTPSNPILHTTRLKNLFSEYKEGVVYKSVPLFYEGWNNETSEELLACDEEVQLICKKLNCFDLSYVKSLRIHYESPTAEALTKKITSITGFKGLTSPTIAVEGGYIPDLQSRYFTADFPYGLSILVQIADLIGVDAPNMNRVLDWYHQLVGECNEYNFNDYGIDSLESFLSFYSK